MIEISVIAVLALAVAALSFRLLKLRNGGTAALLRDMPEMGEGRWRHGVVRYRESQAEFYRLSSVRLWPDRQLSRRDLEIIDIRLGDPQRRVLRIGDDGGGQVGTGVEQIVLDLQQ